MRLLSEDQRKYRALVVDDDRTCLQLAQSMLGQEGLAADIARSAHEAMALCRTSTYDLIFMDLQMPHIDGMETVKKIRNLNSKLENAYIIALTGTLHQADQIDACKKNWIQGFYCQAIDKTKT